MPSIKDLDALLSADGGDDNKFIPAKQAGEQIAGTIKSMGTFTNEHGDTPTAVIATDEGAVIMDGKPVTGSGSMSVKFFGTVLQNFVKDNNVQVGDWVALRSLGKIDNKSGTGFYWGWATAHERPSLDDKFAVSTDF